MSQQETNYRDHVIINSASGFSQGPCIASYAVWKPKFSEDGYDLVFNGSLPTPFNDSLQAIAAAMQTAQEKLDRLLADQ